MDSFNFLLIVEGADLHTDAVADALFEAGCDDALLGSRDGVQYLGFDREAESLSQAVRSALADVERVPDLKVVGINEDLPLGSQSRA